VTPAAKKAASSSTPPRVPFRPLLGSGGSDHTTNPAVRFLPSAATEEGGQHDRCAGQAGPYGAGDGR
jgi:hypothetical protein